MRFTGFEDMISYHAERTPEAPALRYEQDGAVGTLTCAELAASVQERRGELRQSGGTCLGVAADGSVECVLTLLAAPAAGMRTVLFDPAMPEETLLAQAARLGVDRMFAEGRLRDTKASSGSGEAIDCSDEKQVSSGSGEAIDCSDEKQVSSGSGETVDCSEDSDEKQAGSVSGNSDCSDEKRKSEDPTAGEILFFTSGTTGAGRAVILTERSLCASAYNGSAMLPLLPEDTLLCILPLNHVFGFVCGFLWGLSCGACVALGRGARHYIDDCAFFQPTAISAVPMLFGFLLKHGLLNPECRLVLVGAGDCPAALLRAAANQGIRVSFGYGLTETSSGVAISVDGDPFAMEVCPDDEITIAEDGEILVKAPTCMMKGYAGEPEATAEVLRDGLLATGDLGYLDQDGKLHVTGRKKEMLVLTDGTKIFLPEVEAELAALLGTEDLAVVLSGERPVLILSGEPDNAKTEKEKTESGKSPGTESEDGESADSEVPDEEPSKAKSVHVKSTEKEVGGGEFADKTAMENEIWEKIRSFQDARPRGQQISAIRWYGKPLPRTATGKLKRWMISV